MATFSPLHGQVCVVTGATSGIGRATALALGRLGADVILIGRHSGRGERIAAKTNRNPQAGRATFHRCDLSDLSQVRVLAERLADRYPAIDVLVNNAGAKFDRFQRSADGIEMTFATNHLGHFLLTALLFERLQAAPAARIVAVAGQSHWGADGNFSTDFAPETYDRKRAAGGAKLANLLFTFELARRTHGTSVVANAVHPGGVATRVNLNNGVWPWLRHIGAHLLHRNLISPTRAAESVVSLAASPQAETGKYVFERRSLEASPVARDPLVASRLWRMSIQMAGLDASLGSAWAVFNPDRPATEGP